MDGSLSSSNSGDGVAPQHCGTNTNYYCPADTMCKPRSQRCTNNEMCDYGGNANDRCFKTTSGTYKIQLGHAELVGSSGSKRNLLEHRFIQYRGFTYEFGSSYGIQILDVNDPMYKYRNNQNINSGGITIEGNSYCTWEDASMFVEQYDDNYNVLLNNCHDFVDGLLEMLTTTSCAEQQSFKKREDRMNQLKKEIDAILTDCNMNTMTSNANSL